MFILVGWMIEEHIILYTVINTDTGCDAKMNRIESNRIESIYYVMTDFMATKDTVNTQKFKNYLALAFSQHTSALLLFILSCKQG